MNSLSEKWTDTKTAYTVPAFRLQEWSSKTWLLRMPSLTFKSANPEFFQTTKHTAFAKPVVIEASLFIATELGHWNFDYNDK